MFYPKLSILSLVILPSMFQVLVCGREHHLLRKATVDINNTTDLYYPDESITTYAPPHNHDENSTLINEEPEFYLYNSKDDYDIQETNSFERGGGFERHLQSKGDWSICSTSSECASRCCSGKYSGNIPKCTPLGGVFDPISNGCVGNGGSSQGTCGGGYVGDGRCADGSCCSKWGWCGSSPDHCCLPSGRICGGARFGNGCDKCCRSSFVAGSHIFCS